MKVKGERKKKEKKEGKKKIDEKKRLRGRRVARMRTERGADGGFFCPTN